MPPPNILYLHSHDTGRYIQPYGYAVRTPQLQRLAEQGVLFRQAFCANPTCSPSRAALLTGMWPHNNGMIGLAHRGARLNDNRQHLASFLKSHGYETALAGVQHETHGDRTALGYDCLLDEELCVPANPDRDESAARRAAAFLAQSHDRPFFLSCGFFTTHRTGRGTQWHNDAASPLGDSRYVRPPAPIPDTPETRRDFADWAESVKRLDHYMGIVLAALDAHGLADNTLVICTTDHGIAFPFMKCNLLDHGIGVMLMLRGPGGFAGGQVCDAMVSHLDVFPTVCAVAGLPPPAGLQGHSLVPLVTGRTDKLRDEFFAEVNYHAAYEPMRAVRTSRWKYIRRFDPQSHPVLPNCDDSVTKNALLSNGWQAQPQAPEALYDLVFDPNEACNRAADPTCTDVLADLRQRLDRWMRDTDDPLLRGPVPPWPGMLTNPVTGRSPQEEPMRLPG